MLGIAGEVPSGVLESEAAVPDGSIGLGDDMPMESVYWRAREQSRRPIHVD